MSRNGRLASLPLGWLAVLGAWLALGGCNRTAQLVTETSQPLSYVGEISLGTPVKEGQAVTIPLSFSGGRWGENSGICFNRTKSRVSGAEIELTVITAVCKGSSSPPPEQMVLARVSPGKYTVFYRDPDWARHRLSQIVIP